MSDCSTFVSAVLSISSIAAITDEIPRNLDAQETELNKCEIIIPKWVSYVSSTFISRLILLDLAVCLGILYFQCNLHWLLQLCLLIPYFLVAYKFIGILICFIEYLHKRETNSTELLKYLCHSTLKERLDLLRSNATKNIPEKQSAVDIFDRALMNDVVAKCDVEVPENDQEIKYWAQWNVEIVRQGK